jgi:hypothetical protein
MLYNFYVLQIHAIANGKEWDINRAQDAPIPVKGFLVTFSMKKI